MAAAIPEHTDDVPPIVLIVDGHLDAIEAYSHCLEEGGLWVAKATMAGEAVAAAEELRPDIIVADLEDDGQPDEDLVGAIRHHRSLERVPIIVLASNEAQGEGADTVLTKPVPPQVLLDRTRELLERSHQIRAHSQRVVSRGAELLERSTQLIARGQRRPCPQCGTKLEWVEHGAIGGVAYDYYRWCTRGCGLYCFDREHLKWVKLA
jgi:DNA-binding response OmpR family regulator